MKKKRGFTGPSPPARPKAPTLVVSVKGVRGTGGIGVGREWTKGDERSAVGAET